MGARDPIPDPSCVLVWRPDGFPPVAAATVDGPVHRPSVCCLRSTAAGTRAVVYRAGADRGVAGVLDFLTDAGPVGGRGWTGQGVLHLLDPFLPRADLLADPHLRPVFLHIQGRRTLPAAAARRLRELLPALPLTTLPPPV
ncbi:hypothetical protein I4I73_10870 [Pseudonocardia sp. KRD-184]|uniref:Uncharacterized protein n=1 Tax=Pseudonocardia oceani TaxID=2792013 RepID=A0ABS6UAQ7_9PSEU|nr:hypothetical protein [Pseudonocardia oceani]MBW0089477.1 hypothetical protein [Pseudonocardia oceani]MBW0096489.1 hypothetical protein [Pseudonocardia oceani]MBW0109422.1 hypothetical protein [Pseudonocardia oceani]MBW0123332.1 hypothetical protein [Pseudonocardia oceani]MBW0129310.1 hypothetical protein [Pseudonocardia oceani]